MFGNNLRIQQPRIYISRSAGYGNRKLVAFHNALEAIGVKGYNLINASHITPYIIPANSQINVSDKIRIDKPVGSRLYVVIAESYVDHYTKRAVSGLAWLVDSENKGLIAEVTGNDYDNVSRTLDLILEEMTQSSSWLKHPFKSHKLLQTAATNSHKYGCALVIAAIDYNNSNDI